jgi:predicted negative regulator of RcsB-dependent stress response
VEDLSEKEQLDAMRTWWSENGSYVIGGIAVGIIIIFGTNQWRSTIANAEVAASSLYEDVMYAAGRGNLDEASVAAADLYSDYGTSPYAAQARLAMARVYMDNARDQDAADQLTALIESTPDTELAMVGRLRLAKILLYQGKAEEVVGLVRDQVDNAFSARLNEVLGDAYVALAQYTEAEAAYMAALSDNPQAPTVDVSLIQLKINDLPVIADVASETGTAEPAEEGAATEENDASSIEEMPAEEPPAEAPAEAESGNE